MKALLRFLALLLLAAPAHAAPPPVDAASVAGWADPLFRQALAKHRLSGGVVAVVQDGKTLFERGYGAADAARGTPFDPARTRVRIGSATKTFTAIALEQLVQRGLVRSLDDPANLYLRRMKLPKYQGRDITIRELATHRAGFANRTFGIGSDAPYTPFLSAGAIERHAVPIVRSPGGRAVYSNYSTTVLGILVEDVSGLPMADYLQRNVFAPLGMASTELAYGGTAPPGLAQPYGYLPDGTPQPIPFHGIDPFFAPVGAIVSTADDMARYMNTLLAGARGEETPLGLAPPRFAELFERHAGNHPAVLGFGTVFMTLDWGEMRTVGHGGDWPGFHSIFWLMPEKNTGLFLSLMAETPSVDPLASLFSDHGTPDPARPVELPLSNIGVFTDFMRHFYGDGQPPRADLKGEKAIPVAELVGSYRHEYRAYGTLMEILDLFNLEDAVVRVEAAKGGLTIGGRGPYRPIAPNVYWNADLDASLGGSFTQSPIWAFSREADGTISLDPRLAIDPFVKVGWLANPATYAAMLPFLLLAGLASFGAAFWRARRMVAGRVTRIAAICTGIFAILLPLALLTFWTGSPLVEDFLLGQRLRFVAVALIATLLALGWSVLIVGAGRNLLQLVRGEQTFLAFEHGHLLLLALGGLGWIALLWRFNLIGIWL